MTEIGIVELRQYTLLGGKRDQLIEQFEAQFIDAQHAEGAQVLGTFCDADDPDRFVWLRDFADFDARAEILDSFYTGAVWQRERDAANATMLDSDNVLLLRPLDMMALAGWSQMTSGSVEARIIYLGDAPEDAFLSWFDAHMHPALKACGSGPIATLMSEARANNYPRLPVRPERVFIWLAKWPDQAAAQQFEEQWSSNSGWRDTLPEPLLPALMRKPERLRLRPTGRSALK